MSLSEAIAYALSHNPRLLSAAARVERASGEIDSAKSIAQPVFKLSGSARLQSPTQAISIQLTPQLPPHSVRITRTDYATIAFGVVWPLWTGGRAKAAVGAAHAELAATEADLQQATEQLLYEVGLAYYRVLSAQHAVEGAEAAVVLEEENLRMVRLQQQTGIATQADVSKVEATHRHVTQLLAAAQTALQDAKQALNTLLSRSLAEPVQLVDTDLEVMVSENLDDSVKVALATRPELIALEQRSEAAKQALAQAHAERNPTLAAVAQVAWQTPSDVMEHHAEFFGIEFSWPVLHHPHTDAKARQARATITEIAHTRHELERLVALQVNESAHRIADAQELLAATAETVQAAEDAASQAQAAYEAGTATRDQLLAAQTAFTQAQANEAQARCILTATRLTHLRALGLLRTVFLIPAEEAP
ncbi:MAG: TolC family protein [Candidatus Zipacnadales bacterium]